jgi:hypothetical protein
MDAILESKAVHDDVHRGCLEVTSDQLRDSPGDTAMRGRVLGVIGRCAERKSGRVSNQFRVAASNPDRGHGSPKAVIVLGVEAPDHDVGISGPQDCHEPCAIRNAQVIVLRQVSKSACVLLSGVFGPEKTNLGLARCANRAVHIT